MLIAVAATALLALVLLADAIGPALVRRARGWRTGRAAGRRPRLRDPFGLRAAERRGRELLAGLLEPDDLAMYDELGFVRVAGRRPSGPPGVTHRATAAGASYAYLVVPHQPVVAYLPQTAAPIAEYRMPRPDPHSAERLADADDVAATWMLLRDGEELLLSVSAVDRPGHARSREHVRRELWRMRTWEARRLGDAARAAEAAHPPSPVSSARRAR